MIESLQRQAAALQTCDRVRTLYSTLSEKMSLDHRSTRVMLRPKVRMFCSMAGLEVQVNFPVASQLAS